MRPRTRVLAVRAVALGLIGALLVGPAFPATARADDAAGTDSAANHFRHGVTLYKDADYEGALVEFRRAQDLAPNFRVLYNIGQSLYQLQRYAEALKAFEDYLAQGGTQIAPIRRASVDADLRALRGRVARVDVTVNVDGAEIRVDDRTVGTSPLDQPVVVSVGHRKVTVIAPDRVPAEKFVDLAVGDRTKLNFDLVYPVSATAPQPPKDTSSTATTTVTTPPPRDASGGTITTPPPPPPPPPGPSYVWLPWTTTGLLAVGTAVTGALALTAKQSLSNDLGTFPGNANAINQDATNARDYAIASDVFLGAAAVSFIIAVYVSVRSPHSQQQQTGQTGLGVGPRLGAGGLGEAGPVRLQLGLNGALVHVDF